MIFRAYDSKFEKLELRRKALKEDVLKTEKLYVQGRNSVSKEFSCVLNKEFSCVFNCMIASLSLKSYDLEEVLVSPVRAASDLNNN